MKKIVLLAAFLISLTINSNAQNDFRFGFQVSPNYTWLTSNDNQINGDGGTVGLKLGMMGEYFFRENYAFIGGIGFAFNQGGTLQHDTGGNFWAKSELSSPELYLLPNGVKLSYAIQYVEIPFGLKMRTQEFGYLRYFAEIPVFTLGILTKAQGDIEGTNVTAEQENIKSDVNPINFSWGLGGGVEYGVNENTSIVAGLFFQQGFIDVTKNKGTKLLEDGSTEEEDSKSNLGSVTFRIGVMF